MPKLYQQRRVLSSATHIPSQSRPANRQPLTSDQRHINERVESAIDTISSSENKPKELDDTLQKDCETLERFLLKFLMKSKEGKIKKTLSIPVYLDRNRNLCIGDPEDKNTPFYWINYSRPTTDMFKTLLTNNSKFKSANKLAALIRPPSPLYLFGLNNHKMPTDVVISFNNNKILTAVVKCPDLIPLLPKQLLNDSNFMLSAIKANPKAIMHLPEKFLNDNFILRAIKENPRVIMHLPKQLLNHNNFMAIQTIPGAIDYLTPDQKEYIIKMDPIAAGQCKALIADLIYTNKLQNIIKTTASPEFILLAEHTIRRFNFDGYPGSHTPITDYNFNHRPEYLINKKHPPDSLLRYANDELRQKPDFVIKMGIVNPDALYYADLKLTQNASFIEQAFKLDSLMVPEHAFVYADSSINIKESEEIWDLLKKKGAFHKKNRDRLCISVVQKLLNDTRNNLKGSVAKQTFLELGDDFDAVYNTLIQNGILESIDAKNARLAIPKEDLDSRLDVLTVDQKNQVLPILQQALKDIPKEIGKTKIMKALSFLEKEFTTPQLISKDVNNKDYLKFMLELVRRNPDALRHADPELARNTWFLDHLNKHIPHQTIPEGAFMSPEIDFRQSKRIYDLMKKHPNKTDCLLDPTGRIQHKPNKESLRKLLEELPTKHVKHVFFEEQPIKYADHIFKVLTSAYDAPPANENDTLPWVIETYASDEFKNRLPTMVI